MNATVVIEELDADAFDRAVPDLAETLRACVLAGASIGFILPFPFEAAADFWRSLIPAVRTGDRRLLVARLDERIVGTVQVVLSMPANGRHRAEIAKMLVHPSARRRGIARALMMRAEETARQAARSLLVLDTRTGDKAEPLYRSLGFALVGVVPAYARSIEGVLESTSVMYKLLEPDAIMSARHDRIGL
ncbi:MAG TPA: GNAT family N-acetyltransferase [Aliidongia sp.]|nr:GNAT family N-acetyltransferase [Aliidongia sp.]